MTKYKRGNQDRLSINEKIKKWKNILTFFETRKLCILKNWWHYEENLINFVFVFHKKNNIFRKIKQEKNIRPPLDTQQFFFIILFYYLNLIYFYLVWPKIHLGYVLIFAQHFFHHFQHAIFAYKHTGHKLNRFYFANKLFLFFKIFLDKTKTHFFLHFCSAQFEFWSKRNDA